MFKKLNVSHVKARIELSFDSLLYENFLKTPKWNVSISVGLYSGKLLQARRPRQWKGILRKGLPLNNELRLLRLHFEHKF